MRFFYVSDAGGENILELLANDLTEAIRILWSTKDVENQILHDLHKQKIEMFASTYTFESYPVTQSTLLYNVSANGAKAFAASQLHTGEEIETVIRNLQISLPQLLKDKKETNVPAFALMVTSNLDRVHFSDITRGKKLWVVSESEANKPDIVASIDQLPIDQLPKFTRLIIDSAGKFSEVAANLLIPRGYLYLVSDESPKSLNNFTFSDELTGSRGDQSVRVLKYVYAVNKHKTTELKGRTDILDELNDHKIKGKPVYGALVLWSGHNEPDLGIEGMVYHIGNDEEMDPDILVPNRKFITTEYLPSFNGVWDVSKNPAPVHYQMQMAIGSDLTRISDGNFFYLLPDYWVAENKRHPDYLRFIHHGHTLSLQGEEKEMLVAGKLQKVYVLSHT